MRNKSGLKGVTPTFGRILVGAPLIQWLMRAIVFRVDLINKNLLGGRR
jgi:hypothetical protein